MASSNHYSIAIIGAGLSGIAAGYRLLSEGITDFIIIEKGNDIGGTWRDNTYPGCACDIPSALYSYSFNKKPNWSRTFAQQKEILDYIKNTAKKFNIMSHIKLNTAIKSGYWDNKMMRWVAKTTQGLYTADSVISCTGYLHLPKIPDFPGRNLFGGETFHSSQWRHDINLNGKTIAVIGSGASAIQFVPEIQKKAKQIYYFQRTAPWVLPKPDRETPALEKLFLKLPLTLSTWRNILFGSLEFFGLALRSPRLLKPIEIFARTYLKRVVPDKELREKLTPDFTIGCKRMLLSNNYYPALCQSNIEVINSGVSAITKDSVLAENGEQRKVDIIIYGTGFYVTDSPTAELITGKGGQTLASIWQGSPEAYLGTVINGFPNFFMVLGPNIGFAHSSATIVIEAQLDYIVAALKIKRKQGIKSLDIKPAVQKKYNRKVQKNLINTVWNTGGCSSYYLDQNGKNSVIFPWSNITLKRWLGNFDIDKFNIN